MTTTAAPQRTKSDHRYTASGVLCTGCRESRPESEFRLYRDTGKPYSRCRRCETARARRYRAAGLGRMYDRRAKLKHRASTSGDPGDLVVLAEFNERLAAVKRAGDLSPGPDGRDGR